MKSMVLSLLSVEAEAACYYITRHCTCIFALVFRYATQGGGR